MLNVWLLCMEILCGFNYGCVLCRPIGPRVGFMCRPYDEFMLCVLCMSVCYVCVCAMYLSGFAYPSSGKPFRVVSDVDVDPGSDLATCLLKNTQTWYVSSPHSTF